MPTSQQLRDELESLTKVAARALTLVYDIAATHGNSGNKLNYQELERITNEIRADIKRAELLIEE